MGGKIKRVEEDSNIAVEEEKRGGYDRKRTEYSIEGKEEMVKREREEEEEKVRLKLKLEKRQSGERQTAKAHLPDWEVYRVRRYRIRIASFLPHWDMLCMF